jgi:hypothetical protein
MSDSPSTSHPSLFDKDYGDKSHGSSGPDSKIEADPDSETPDSETPDSKTPDSKTVGAASPPASGPPSGKASEERSPRRDSSGDRNSASERNATSEDPDEDFSRDGGKGSSELEKPSGEKESPGPTGGRPPKSPESRKTERISICVTEELKAEIADQADRANLSQSGLARRALAGVDLKTRADQKVLDMLYQVGARMRDVQEAIEAGRRPEAADIGSAIRLLQTAIGEIDQQKN